MGQYTDQQLVRIASALERIADTLASLDEPQTFEVDTLVDTRGGTVTTIREVKDQ